MAKVNVNRATHEELVEAAGLRPQVAEAVLRLRDEHGGRIADLEALKEIKGIGDATLDHLREVLVAGKRPDEGAAPKKGPDGDAAPRKGEEAPAREDAEVTTLAAKSGSGGAGAARADAGVTAFAAKSGGGGTAAHKGAEVTAFAAKSGSGDDAAARRGDNVAREEGAEASATAARAGTDTTRKGAEVTAFVAKGAAEAGQLAARAGAEGAGRFAAAGAEQTRRALGTVAEAQRRATERSSEAVSDLSGLVVDLVAEQARHNVETFQALARARSFREAAEIQGGYLRASVERATRGTTRYVEVVTKLVAGMAA